MIPSYKTHLEQARKSLAVADHIASTTYPLFRDKRLLLRGLEKVYDSITNTINAILQYEYIQKKIKLHKSNPKANLKTFMEKCAQKYLLSKEEINDIQNLLSLFEDHKKSSMEFQRRDKIVILSDNLSISLIDLEKLKKCIFLAKKVLQKAQITIISNSL